VSNAQAAPPRSLADRLFVASQYLLPQHTLSRFVYYATRSRSVWFKNCIIRSFVRGFRPAMADALEPEPTRYATFNEFFTRALRPGARTPARDANALLAPVDGAVSEAGAIRDGRLLQAKGFDYTLAALLANDGDWTAQFAHGEFATFYLAPYDYHRVHMPAAGTLREAWYVPGRLFSVNARMAAAVPRLFARNERVVCCFAAKHYRFAVILVGALHVGSISTVWHGEVTPRRPRHITRLSPLPEAAPLTLPAGAELGRFNMGSTVIVLCSTGAASWDASLGAGRIVRMGERIGQALPRATGPSR
jgi:phosphatidylserine decarboxylase